MIRRMAKNIIDVAEALKKGIENLLEGIDDQYYQIIMSDIDTIIMLAKTILTKIEECKIDYDEIRNSFTEAKNKYKDTIWRHITVGPPNEAD